MARRKVGGKKMAMAQKILKDQHQSLRKERKDLIRKLTNKICDRNDEALRRLAKN